MGGWIKESKMNLKCNDCGESCEEDLNIKAESTRYEEIYYEGEPICDKCLNKRYEAFIRSKENG